MDSGGRSTRLVRAMLQHPERVYRVLFAVVVAFFLVKALFPVYWLFVVALTPADTLRQVGFTPNEVSPEIFLDLFATVPLHRYVLNSVLVASATTAIVLVVGTLAGYVFGRLEFPGRVPVFFGILVVALFPPTAFFLPLFLLFTGNVSVAGVASPTLFNTHAAVVFPLSALVMPLAVYLLATFYSQIPDGLEDVARVSGSTRLGALARVVVPLSAPGVATVGVLSFIVVYNEFFFSYLMFDGTADVHLLPHAYLGMGNYPLLAAASIVGVVPMALLVLVAQRWIVSGLTAGAVDG